MACDSKKSSDAYNLDMKTLKMAANFTVGPLEHIFNLSLSTGLVPNVLKTSAIIPVFKYGGK